MSKYKALEEIKLTPKYVISLFKLSRRTSSGTFLPFAAGSRQYSFNSAVESASERLMKAPNDSGNFGDGEGL